MTPLCGPGRSIEASARVERPSDEHRPQHDGLREDAMTSASDDRRFEINRTLLVGGAVLMSVGAVVGMAGALATSVAVIQAARSWIGQLDEPPSVIARRRLAQARTAANAGAQGWREHAMRLQAQAADVDGRS
jgi:hypothetical protein